MASTQGKSGIKAIDCSTLNMISSPDIHVKVKIAVCQDNADSLDNGGRIDATTIGSLKVLSFSSP
jgi:hypothetical protein